MKPEVYFLKYAFPCAQVLRDIRKTITEEEYLGIRKAALNDEALPREYLEKIFEKAAKGMKEISNDIWSIGTIRKYFHGIHDGMISKDLPPTIRRLCRVRKGKVTAIKENVLIVDLGDEKRNLIPLYNNPETGDEVFIHYGYAVEKTGNE